MKNILYFALALFLVVTVGCAQQSATTKPAEEAPKAEETQPPPEPETQPQEQPQEAVTAPEPLEFGVVYFDFDRSEIKPEFDMIISANAMVLMNNPEASVVIEGHCDERGTNEYNMALGERRAQSVREALIAKGVNASQLTTISFGEERPVEMGHDEDSWSKNRRSAIVTAE